MAGFTPGQGLPTQANARAKANFAARAARPPRPVRRGPPLSLPTQAAPQAQANFAARPSVAPAAPAPAAPALPAQATARMPAVAAGRPAFAKGGLVKGVKHFGSKVTG